MDSPTTETRRISAQTLEIGATTVTTRVIGYWLTTALITFELLVGGTADLLRGRTLLLAGDPVTEVVAGLGYPVYVLTILGIWKLIGTVALLVPGFHRIKEWAYAGAFFLLTGAAASNVASGHGLADAMVPALFAACAVGSWALQPQTRSHARGPTAAPSETRLAGG